jgi:hypothetical protein
MNKAALEHWLEKLGIATDSGEAHEIREMLKQFPDDDHHVISDEEIEHVVDYTIHDRVATVPFSYSEQSANVRLRQILSSWSCYPVGKVFRTARGWSLKGALKCGNAKS